MDGRKRIVNIRHVKGIFTIGASLLLGMAVLFSPPLFAAEETAHMTFEKGKVSKKDTYRYQIKRGDTLFSLISTMFKPDSSQKRKEIYKAIKQLNPKLTSIHKIYAGQKLRLPGKYPFANNQKAATLPEKTTGSGEVDADSPDPSLHSSDYRMSIIREVVTRMRGTITTAGNYHIPLPQSGQITLDCARIPVVELADGSIILLDFSQRISASLKKSIHDHWPNYYLVTISPQDNPLRILQKMINASKAYSLSKMQKPLEIGKGPQLQIASGWLITEKSARGEKIELQLITFLQDSRFLLPKAFIRQAERNGLVVTDIIEGRGLVDPPGIQQPPLSIPHLKTSTNMDLCVDLLNIFNLQPSRNVDMKIFDQNRDGFNLSINADLLIKQGNKRTMFHAKPLPPQFIDILRENGIDPIELTEKDSRRTTVEKTLHGIGASYSPGTFSFSVPEKVGKPRGTIRFPAIRVTLNSSFRHLIEFDMDQDLYQLLHQQWEVNLIKY